VTETKKKIIRYLCEDEGITWEKAKLIFLYMSKEERGKVREKVNETTIL